MSTKSPESLFEREWIFNKEDTSGPPHLGVSFSGGGNRSAAFAIGVLRGLHEKGLLRKVDVFSAVSGGSYALTWLLLQPFYHNGGIDDPKTALGRIQKEMFDIDGPFQRYLVENAKPLGVGDWISLIGLTALMLPFDLAVFNALRAIALPLSMGRGAARTANVLNAMSLARANYREGLQLTYQVSPDPGIKAQIPTFLERGIIAGEHLDLTRDDVPPVSFPTLSNFARRAGLPGFIFNTTVVPPSPGSLVPLRDRIFELGPIGFGSDSCGYVGWEDTEGLGWEPGAPMEKGSFWKRLNPKDNRSSMASPYATIRNFNIASAISGAALSGTNIEERKARRFLRLLNLGLEYVVPNPGDPRRAIRLSDGGHSENLGAYALLRRGCRTILVVDAEHDPSYSFSAYRKLKAAVKEELGIEVDIPRVEKILAGTGTFTPDIPVMEGTITYNGRPSGRMFYMKLSMHEALLAGEAGTVKSYAKTHAAFPQESTIDQYFQPAQFKAYRSLGYAIAGTLDRGIGT